MANVRTISSRECEITQAVAMAQMHMLDLASRKHGFTRKVLHLQTGIPLTTLKSYEEGTAMPMAAFVKIIGVKDFPNELASLMLEAGGKTVADAEPDEGDIDDLVLAAAEVIQRYVKARHPASPSGIRIDHTEIGDIKHAAKGLASHAKKVAA